MELEHKSNEQRIRMIVIVIVMDIVNVNGNEEEGDKIRRRVEENGV